MRCRYQNLWEEMLPVAEDLANDKFSAHRRAFGKLLEKCVIVLQYLEAIAAGEIKAGSEKKAIICCIGIRDILDQGIHNAEPVKEELESLIEIAKNAKYCEDFFE